MQDEMTLWTTAMAEREARLTAPKGLVLTELLVELAAARGRALPALDADERDMILERVRDALEGRI